MKKKCDIRTMPMIRVIVKNGGGHGHQRAAITLMKRLRELGFKGIFDIWWECGDGESGYVTEYGKRVPGKKSVGQKLKNMIPEIKLHRFLTTPKQDLPVIGKAQLTALHKDSKYQRLQPEFSLVELAVCAAHDSKFCHELENAATLYNAEAYVSLNPSDWSHMGPCFTITPGKKATLLPDSSTMRLSASIQPSASLIRNNDTAREIVHKRMSLLSSNPHYDTQLMYGLMPHIYFTYMNRIWLNENERDCGEATATGYEAMQHTFSTLLKAHLHIQDTNQRTTVLFAPQQEALTLAIPKDVICLNLTEWDEDLTPERLQKAKVIIAYTGKLSMDWFECLMIHSSFPPMIEGCNSRETCDYMGHPFIAIHKQNEHIREYDVASTQQQDLHRAASKCLSNAAKDLAPLIKYLQAGLNKDPDLMRYHQQRQQEHAKRPDACVAALSQLGIAYRPEKAVSVIPVSFIKDHKRHHNGPNPPTVLLP